MTNQEAIEILREKIFPCVIGDWKEAVGVAISALQAQEAKHSTESSLTQKALDTISRQAAIDVCDYAIDLWHGQLGEGIVIAVKKKIEELPSAQPESEERKAESAQNVPKEDLISRKAAIDALMDFDKKLRKINWYQYPHTEYECRGVDEAIVKIENVPSAQTEPLSDAYTKAVWTWLLDYQIKAAELKGRYTPYEVLSWVANDWRKEHERSD